MIIFRGETNARKRIVQTRCPKINRMLEPALLLALLMRWLPLQTPLSPQFLNIDTLPWLASAPLEMTAESPQIPTCVAQK